MFGAISGAVSGLVFAAIIAGTEIFLPRTRAGRALDRAPLLVAFAIKLVLYSLAVFLAAGSKANRWLGAYVVFGPEGAARALEERGFPIAVSIMLTLLVAAIAILLIQVVGLVGGGNLRDIVIGRYRRSRIEERFFLFVDIVGSTPLAEKLGPASVHRFLDRVFQIASDPIDDHAGEVYQYVGDEVVITWLAPIGRISARPLACYFAIEQALRQAASEFEREFGTVPRLRGALHAGQVITGQVGGTRRAIVFHGDVLNTTSRIENATRELNTPFLVSEDALGRLDGTSAYSLTDLGLQQLRGRAASMRVFSAAAR